MRITAIASLSLPACVALLAYGEQDSNLRVVWSADPQHQAVVVWDGEAQDASASVVYDTRTHAGGGRSYAFTAPLSASGPYHDGRVYKPGSPAAAFPGMRFYHHALLEGLRPDTVYYLAVDASSGTGREYHFKTAPESGPLALLYAGDSRTHIGTARKVSEQIRAMVARDDSIVALLHGGDYAATTRREPWKAWLDAYSLTTTEAGKLLPIIPVIGNHDVVGKSPIFRQAYGFPGGSKDYYACRLTPDIGIVCLNTEIATAGDQQAFLEKALAGFDKDRVKWRIAAYHKPAFPAVKQPSSAKVSWVPLFEHYNVDLVLESDGHCIKRTVPIRDDQPSPDGVVYLGEGGYGAPQRQPKPDRWYLQGDQAFTSKGDHIMLLRIGEAAIDYSAILASGEVIDSTSFKSRR